jgi:hypothetical protein
MRAMQDITVEIHADGINSRELVQILANRFGTGRYTAMNQVDIPDSDTPRLTLHYTKKGAISKVLADISPAEVAEIAGKVEDKLLAPAHPRVSRKILFAQVPTTG